MDVTRITNASICFAPPLRYDEKNLEDFMGLRPAETFFYGLFMDEELLRAKGLDPKNVELASVAGCTLRIGRRATLEPNPNSRVHGVLMSLAWAELQRLYSEPGVEEYRPEAVLAQPASGGLVAAL